ncbi:MAG: 4Fe-4S dicluster domain-containing protein, partial [Desulfosalsimonas sp.]
MKKQDESQRNTAYEQIHDTGIEQGAARLSREKISSVINKLIETEGGARLSAYINACVRCGLCSEACHHYLSNDRNPRFSPAGKVKQTMSEILAKKGQVSPDFMKKACEIAFTECNLCRRCQLYCPFGIAVSYMMLFV